MMLLVISLQTISISNSSTCTECRQGFILGGALANFIVRITVWVATQFVQRFLLLPDVPVETLGQRVEPVGNLILGADGRNGVDTGGHPQTVPVAELLPLPPVEADPGRVAAIGGDRDLELHPGRNHNWSE